MEVCFLFFFLTSTATQVGWIGASQFILSWTVTFIGVQKGCSKMFMWKTNNCFVFFNDILHCISYNIFVGERG